MILITLVVIGYKEVVASANTKTSSRENSDQHPADLASDLKVPLVISATKTNSNILINNFILHFFLQSLLLRALLL